MVKAGHIFFRRCRIIALSDKSIECKQNGEGVSGSFSLVFYLLQKFIIFQWAFRGLAAIPVQSGLPEKWFV